MRRRRLVAAGFFSVAMAAVLAAIVYTEHVSSTSFVSVWMLTHDVAAGSTYRSEDVQQVQLKAQPGDFQYELQGPNEYQARYAHALSTHDILRSDDLVAAGAEAEISLTVQNPPPLNAGDLLDVYAALPSSQQAMVGHDITVETVSGGALTVLVPAADESAWVAISSSNVALHVVRTVAGARGPDAPLSSDEAIRILCGAACSGPPQTVAATP